MSWARISREEEIPEDMTELAQEYHEKLLEAVSDEDDEHHGAVSQR